MRILHTSDWHLGKRLCEQERENEYRLFLDWLTALIEEKNITALLVTGDIYDSATPPLWAQGLYLSFLVGLRKTCCKSVVITGGNHDSLALLDLTRDILKSLGVYVVGVVRSPGEEVFVLPDETGEAGAVCCAVPYLRARDLYTVVAGESPDAIRAAELEGFRTHYLAVCKEAERVRAGRDIPLIATGHCFVAGGRFPEDDGMRSLAVGSLENVPPAAFPDSIDYLALGHLHSPQSCGKSTMRYSGAPLVLGFGEAGIKKTVTILDTEGRRMSVSEEAVPVFRNIMSIRGTLKELTKKITELSSSPEEIWLRAECTESVEGSISDTLREVAGEDGPVRLLRVQPLRTEGSQTLSGGDDLTEDWSPQKVFRTFLDDHSIEEPDAGELMRAYLEIVNEIQSEDAGEEK